MERYQASFLLPSRPVPMVLVPRRYRRHQVKQFRNKVQETPSALRIIRLLLANLFFSVEGCFVYRSNLMNFSQEGWDFKFVTKCIII